jgi:hypothetical protein
MSSVPPIRSQPAEGRLPAEARRRAERDWVFFLLEELSGLGDLLRFRRDQDGEGADIAAALGRARAIVDALGWQREAALAHTWAFVRERLRFPGDAWGPSLVLDRLELDRGRVEGWRAGLSDGARALLAATPAPLAAGPASL